MRNNNFCRLNFIFSLTKWRTNKNLVKILGFCRLAVKISPWTESDEVDSCFARTIQFLQEKSFRDHHRSLTTQETFFLFSKTSEKEKIVKCLYQFTIFNKTGARDFVRMNSHFGTGITKTTFVHFNPGHLFVIIQDEAIDFAVKRSSFKQCGTEGCFG